MPAASQFTTRIAAAPLALRLGDAAQGDLTFLREVRGGTVVGEVTSSTSGNEHFARKHLDGTRNEEFQIEVGMAMTSRLFDWLADSWSPQPSSHDGAVLVCDHDYKIRLERGFMGALISEIGFPAFDAASKESGYLTVRFAPDSILQATSPGTKLTIGLSKGSKQKLWLTSNFRLQIDGLDCAKVSRVAPFAVQRPIEQVTSGAGTGLIAGQVDFPSLRIDFSAASAPSWVDWHHDFVVLGNNGPDAERNGSLSLLAPDLTELARIDFAGLGIFRLTADSDADTSTAKTALMTAELYCEQMSLGAGASP
jgi:hypothetical protein